MFENQAAEEAAWLIKTVYEAALKDDREEGYRVFNALMSMYERKESN